MTKDDTKDQGAAGDRPSGSGNSGSSGDQQGQTIAPPDRPSVVEPTDKTQRDNTPDRPRVVEPTVEIPCKNKDGQWGIGPSQPLNDPDQ